MKSYLKHKISNLVEVRSLMAVEYLDFDGKYKNYIEKHDFWELCFVEKGEIKLTVEGNCQILEADSIVLIPLGKNHSYCTTNYGENKVFVICFQSFSQALNLLSEIKMNLTFENAMYMKRIISEGFATFRSNNEEYLEIVQNPVIGGQQMIVLHLESILIIFLRLLAEKEKFNVVFLDEDRFHQSLVDAIISYLQSNIHEKLSLDGICNKFNYSKSFLCKIFKIHTGDSVMLFFNKLKIEEAKNLLEKTEQSITSIADSLGFQEVKYFDYFFKKYVGVSPVTYRKKSKRGINL